MKSKFIDFLKGYEKSEESFKSGAVSRSFEKFTDLTLCGIGSSLSGKIAKSPVARFFGNIKKLVIFASSRAYGTMFLSFGILTLLLHFADYYFRNLPSSPAFSLVVGAVFAVISVPLLFFDIPFADIFHKWRVTDALIFDYLCIKHVKRADGDTPKLSLAVPILVGSALATVGFFLTVKWVLLAAFAAVFLSLSIASPEFSFLITLLCIPLFPILPYSTVILVILVLVTAASFIGKVAVGKRIFHFEQYDALLLIFMLFTLISGIFNKGIKSFESALVIIALCLVYFLASNIIVNRRLADNSVNTVIISSVPTAIYAIIQYFTSTVPEEWIDPAFKDVIASRAVATFGNPNIYSVFLLVCTVFSASFALAKSRKALRPAYVVATALNLTALVLTWTRGAWIAIILSALALIVVKSIRAPKLLLIPLFAVPLALVFVPSSIGARFLSIFSLADTSGSSRLSIWRSSLEMIKSNLFIGAGVGEGAFKEEFSKFAEDSVTAPHSHNLFLEIACEIGVFALAAFLIMLIIRVRHRASYTFYVKRSSVESICTAAAVATFALLAFGLTDYVWYSAPMLTIFWFTFGLGSASLRIARREFDDKALAEYDGNSPYSASGDFTIG